jgi:hypothetical protein
MAHGRRESEGDIAAFMVQMIPVAVWVPNKMADAGNINPFREPDEMSEAMRKHLENWDRAKWRGMVRSNHDAGGQ